MKKIKSLFTIGAFLLGISCFAQDDDDMLSPKVGIKGGVNLANLRVDEVGDNNLKVGLNLGVFAKLPLGEAFAIQPELLYSSKGAKLSYDNFILGEGEYRFNLNYVELPVLAVFNLGEHFNIHVGPYLGFLASANIKDLDDDGTIQDIDDLEVDNFNRFDYGVAGGIGFDLEGVMIGARYTYGLNEVGEDGSLSGELTDNSKNSVGTIYIAFGF